MEYVPDRFKTEDICNEAVGRNPYTLDNVPDRLKTQEMCNGAMHENPATFFLVPDLFKTQLMCFEALEVDPWQLKDVHDHFKMQTMCNGVVMDYLFSLQFVLDWLVTQQQIDRWYDDHYVYNDDKLSKWYEGHQKRKSQKVKIKEEFLPIAWHPSRWWDWCIPEDEKKETEKL